MAHVALGGALDEFIARSKAKHGEAGERAARFLVEHMPSKDREGLSVDFLVENLDLAFRAREEFGWAKVVPEAIFLNDVLPYAVFDETRDPWRAEFYEKSKKLVTGAKTASEAAQALNRQLFNLVKVHYNTGRKRPNQSPKESMELGKATCTGLSIIMVDACRAVGIPARAVGTPLWANERGNHTWVEIWDGDWHFTGADEYDKGGLNRGWFVNDASQAKADSAKHSIYATSWKREGLAFPMVWARGSEAVAGVNVTGRYAKPTAAEVDPKQAKVGVRLFRGKGGVRMVARVRMVDEMGRVLGEAETKAGTSDLNDMPRIEMAPGMRGWARFTVGREERERVFGPVGLGESTLDAAWDEMTSVSRTLVELEKWVAESGAGAGAGREAKILRKPLKRSEATRAREILAAMAAERSKEGRRLEVEAKEIVQGGKRLRWLVKTFGEAPAGGRSLWISMHGGGGAPAEVNDKQWKNQIELYTPSEGIYVAPRAPTDTWNLWHEGHIDGMFQRLIEDYVVLMGVNPNKVYLMGYSAGGDGVWQLAPRMADRFAAAAMMAGHPNEASMEGLRNLPFAIFMGANDSAYNRNKVANERVAELGRMSEADPGGYPHMSRIYEGLGHWMQRRDAEALPWMAKHERTVWPRRVVWRQDDVVHRRFYWLRLADGAVIGERQRWVATVKGQVIELESEGGVPKGFGVGLSDELLDLDRPVVVKVNGKKVHSGRVVRRATDILTSLDERLDAASAATASIEIR